MPTIIMNKYKVKLSVVVPAYCDYNYVEVEAENAKEAEKLAPSIFMDDYDREIDYYCNSVGGEEDIIEVIAYRVDEIVEPEKQVA